MPKFLSQSKNMKDEYCGTVVQIGEVKPVPGTDFLGTVMVIGREIIVRKDKVHEGQIMIYVSNECQLNTDFLSVNNEFQDSELNANYDEVLKTKTQMINDGASKEDIEKYVFSKRGYFKKSGRVRMTRIRGVVSMGYLITVEQMKAWCPSFELDAEIGYDFDTVNGELFVKAYMPPRKHDPSFHVGNKEEKRAAKFDGVVKGQFAFHYHPAQLNKDICRLSPDMSVNISVKLHGCVERNTLVDTMEYGQKSIGDIVDRKIDCHIRAFDTAKKEDVYVPIDNFYCVKNEGEWYDIELEDGRHIVITGNNPVWLPQLNTYRRVDELDGTEILQVL